VYYQRATFYGAFLWAKELNARDIHEEMVPVYVVKCLARKAVHSWVEKSSQGRSKVSDDETEVRKGRWDKRIDVGGGYVEK
jgi:hypothetical protein